jgi:hypothetical protein
VGERDRGLLKVGVDAEVGCRERQHLMRPPLAAIDRLGGAAGKVDADLVFHQVSVWLGDAGERPLGLNVLIEQWLALQPERRFTVPPKKKRLLAERAITQVINNEIDDPAILAINVDDVLDWSRRYAPAPTLRRRRS